MNWMTHTETNTRQLVAKMLQEFAKLTLMKTVLDPIFGGKGQGADGGLGLLPAFGMKALGLDKSGGGGIAGLLGFGGAKGGGGGAPTPEVDTDAGIFDDMDATAPVAAAAVAPAASIASAAKAAPATATPEVDTDAGIFEGLVALKGASEKPYPVDTRYQQYDSGAPLVFKGMPGPSTLWAAKISGGAGNDPLDPDMRDGGLPQITDILGESYFDGFRADGGPVSAGRAYVVGERRPEIFMPDVSGHIYPDAGAFAGARGGGGGAANGQVTVTIAPSAEFHASIESTAENVVARRAPEIVGQSVATTQRGLPGMIQQAQKRSL